MRFIFLFLLSLATTPAAADSKGDVLVTRTLNSDLAKLRNTPTSLEAGNGITTGTTCRDELGKIVFPGDDGFDSCVNRFCIESGESQ